MPIEFLREACGYKNWAGQNVTIAWFAANLKSAKQQSRFAKLCESELYESLNCL
jgi:hypothetical protein